MFGLVLCFPGDNGGGLRGKSQMAEQGGERGEITDNMDAPLDGL